MELPDCDFGCVGSPTRSGENPQASRGITDSGGGGSGARAQSRRLDQRILQRTWVVHPLGCVQSFDAGEVAVFIVVKNDAGFFLIAVGAPLNRMCRTAVNTGWKPTLLWAPWEMVVFGVRRSQFTVWRLAFTARRYILTSSYILISLRFLCFLMFKSLRVLL
jgi:hypothetical protein